MPVASDSGTLRADALDRGEQPLHHAEVGVDEALRDRARRIADTTVSGTWQTSTSRGATRAAISVYAASSASALIPAPLRQLAAARHGDAAHVVPVDQAARRLQLGAEQGSRRQHRARADGSHGERAADLVASTGRTHGSIIRGDRRPIGIYIEDPDRPSM